MRQQREQATLDVSDACDTLNRRRPERTRHRRHPCGNHSGRADRDTAVLAPLANAGFLAGLTEHRATTRSYQAACRGDTVHADLAADGGLTLHSTGPDGTTPWEITASGSVPARLLKVLIRACAIADDEPSVVTAPYPDRDGTAGIDLPQADPPSAATRTAEPLNLR